MNLSALCHNEVSFSRLPQVQHALIGQLAMTIGTATSPFESKDFIEHVMSENQIRVQPELFEKLEKDDSLEVWSSDLSFLFAMGQILKLTSYSLDELASIHWSELFKRGDFFSSQLQARFIAALQTGQTQYNVTGWHAVTEVRSARQFQFQVMVKQLTPFHSDGLSGVFALVKSKPLSLRISS